MARTLFFRMVLRKFSKITNNKPIFIQYNIFYNYVFSCDYYLIWDLYWLNLSLNLARVDPAYCLRHTEHVDK